MTTTRGRPRDPARDRAILDAARQVFAARGYTGASMDEIARVAKVGKDTLYRRWSSKDPLAIELLDRLAAESVRPQRLDPDPRLDLLLYLKDVVRLNTATDLGALIAGLVGEAARNPDLATSFRAFWARRRAIASLLVRDVVGDVDDDELSFLLDALLGPLYYRLLLTGDPVGDEMLWQLVTDLPWRSSAVTRAHAPSPSP